jgi:hypothetical protein
VWFLKITVYVLGLSMWWIFYPEQDGSNAYQITDHLGNVRALVHQNINTYTATMKDNNGLADISNPRVEDMQYFNNLFETEEERVASFYRRIE